jgi:hypothetical protein
MDLSRLDDEPVFRLPIERAHAGKVLADPENV